MGLGGRPVHDKGSDKHGAMVCRGVQGAGRAGKALHGFSASANEAARVVEAGGEEWGAVVTGGSGGDGECRTSERRHKKRGQLYTRRQYQATPKQ